MWTITRRRHLCCYVWALSMICVLSRPAHAEVSLMSGTASYGVDIGCSPVLGEPPPSLTPNVFYEEVDLTARPSGRTDNWHGWGSVSWNISTGGCGSGGCERPSDRAPGRRCGLRCGEIIALEWRDVDLG